ncbi:MAG: acetylglutamate kinase [Bacteroidetes bacterium]|nr:acetylglutamate kinase [Bacteroidota bacterium]
MKQTKEEILIEALPYIQKYEGKTFVVKYGGAAQTVPELKNQFAKDVTILKKIGINIVIVHGGGKEITETAGKLGIETRFVNGLRYTDEAMVDVVTMTLAGKINKEIVNLINQNDGEAVGISGIDNSLFTAEQYYEEGADIGLVGKITAVNTSFIHMFLEKKLMPVIAPLGVDKNGTTYNVNADLAAAAVASSLQAEKLVYLSDVEGVLANNKLISTLNEQTARELVNEGIINGGMIPKVKSAFSTLHAGVAKVHMIDGRKKHSLLLEIFTDEGIGTELIL